MMRLPLLVLLILLSAAAQAAQSVKFFYDANAGGTLTCDPGPASGTSVPFECRVPAAGDLRVALDNWGWEGGTVITSEDGKPSVIGGLCAGSVVKDLNVESAFQLNPTCLAGDAPPPTPSGEILVADEWFSDLPWHQKLSTKDSNLIDVPFVLPFAALPKALIDTTPCFDQSGQRDEARCMLQYGILNVMGFKRSDRVYGASEVNQLTPDACRDDECVEVRLDVHRFHTATDSTSGQGYVADEFRNNKSAVTKPPASLGLAVTEATIFAPWRAWFTGHYCAVWAEIADSVCYDDYFTTQLVAPASPGVPWIKRAPALFWPRGTEKDFEKFCASGEDSCAMYMGKVDWTDPAYDDQGNETFNVVVCDTPAGSSDPETMEFCRKQVMDRSQRLDDQVRQALTSFADDGRFPWYEVEFNDDTFYKGWTKENIAVNPFIGYYDLQRSEIVDAAQKIFKFDSPHYALPKRCTKTDYRNARQGDSAAIERLAECAVNIEIHTNGFYEYWKDLYDDPLPLEVATIQDISKAMPDTPSNQYGRTMFLFAGVPEQHIPVSFEVQNEIRGNGGELLLEEMSVYDKVYNGSKYIQYLPMVNPADQSLETGKNYADEFWHAFFMSNHMNQTPDHFIRGIRGRTLWHNEYRSNWMYKAATERRSDGKRTVDGTKFEDVLEHVDFPAGFQSDPMANLAPYHGNTCDSCHIRNGSGIPLMPNGKLPEIHGQRNMNTRDEYKVKRDYTYSNHALPPMKMVLFDLRGPSGSRASCDDNNHTVPKSSPLAPLSPAPARGGALYKNKVMNFYGNSFHLFQAAHLRPDQEPLVYDLSYQDICTTNDQSGYELVDKTLRYPVKAQGDSSCRGQQWGSEPGPRWSAYQPRRIKVDLSAVEPEGVCWGIAAKPSGVAEADWPDDCQQVGGDAINNAIRSGEIGFMHLMGRRLGNTPMIEMMPVQAILDAQAKQAELLDALAVQTPRAADGDAAGCVSLAPGTRVGRDGGFNYRSCASAELGEGGEDCYIGRWGWIGDRASLEDQVANAAHMEMNISSSKSFEAIHQDGSESSSHVRYAHTLCGPANDSCQDQSPNSDITEDEIRNMATYQRWIGIPNRSEYQVSSQKVQDGEKVFVELRCNRCHVIDKIPFDFNDNMLPDDERATLQKLAIRRDQSNEYPFISYLGTDLLMHDMGYLSQVAPSPAEGIRKENGQVKPRYRNWAQPIRTPALKGLRFNRFVTDSNHNTTTAKAPLGAGFTPGCDFLLHDGRACDAIEAAFLHDGPMVKSLSMIEKMNKLSEIDLENLRAFLYSL